MADANISLIPHDFLVWTAGFFDGEGSISIAYHRPRAGRSPYGQFVLQVMVAQVTRQPLLDIERYFGDRVASYGIQAKPHHRPCFRWYIAHRPALDFLLKLKQHLRVKYAAVEIAVRFYETFDGTNRHAAYRAKVFEDRRGLREELQRVNGRGLIRARQILPPPELCATHQEGRPTE